MKKRSPVILLAGNIARFDATPIKIYEMLKGIAGKLENPLLISIASLPLYFDSSANRQAESKFRDIGVQYHVIPRVFPISLLILLSLILKYRVRVIHANNHTAAVHGLLVRMILGTRLIFDYHGAIPEEMVERGRWHPHGFRYRLAKSIERKLIINSDRMFVISETCKFHFVKLRPQENPIFVIPCGIRSEKFCYNPGVRIIVRNELGISENIVITYNGTFAPWSMVDAMTAFFKQVRLIFPGSRFLIISPSDPGMIANRMREAGIQDEDLIIRTLPHDQVGRILMAGDLGILFRNRSFVNEVASPMKFAEYLSCGLPVVATPGIGDTAGYLEKYQAGFILNPEDPYALKNMIRSVQDNREEYALRCSDLAKQQFNLTGFDGLYLKAYSDLLKRF